jgi:hypothetical protein
VSIRNPDAWSKHFANNLGSLASEKRAESDALARLIQARIKAAEAIRELQPLIEQKPVKPEDMLLRHAWAHLTDAEEDLAKAIGSTEKCPVSSM